MSSILRQTSYIFQHLSILRNEDDFDESALIFGPATPYVPGVSEPEPAIPLRDTETSRNTRPRFNDTPQNQINNHINSSIRYQMEIPSQRMNSSSAQCIPSNQSRMNVASSLGSNISERQPQMQAQISAEQPTMLPPPLRHFPVENLTTNTSNTFSNNSHYPTMTISSNSFRVQPYNVTNAAQRMPQPQITRLALNGQQMSPPSQNPMQYPRLRFHSFRHPSQSSLQRVDPTMFLSQQSLPSTSNQQQLQSLQAHQQFIRSPLTRPSGQVSNGTSQANLRLSSFAQSPCSNTSTVRQAPLQAQQQNPAYRNSPLQQKVRQSITHQQWEDELQAAWLQIEVLWSRDPRGLQPFITNIMRQSPKDRRKWESWWRYFQNYETQMQMLHSGASQDTIRMTRKVAEIIDTTWVLWNSCNLGQHTNPQAYQKTTSPQMIESNQRAVNSPQRQGQYATNNASNGTKAPPSYSSTVGNNRNNMIPQQCQQQAVYQKYIANAATPMESTSNSAKMSKIERLKNYVYRGQQIQSQNELPGHNTNFTHQQPQTVNNSPQPTDKSISTLSVPTSQSTELIQPNSSQIDQLCTPADAHKIPSQVTTRVSTPTRSPSTSSEVLNSPSNKSQEEYCGSEKQDERCYIEPNNDIQVICSSLKTYCSSENRSNQCDEVQIIRKKHHLAPPNFEKTESPNCALRMNRSPDSSTEFTNQEQPINKQLPESATKDRATPTQKETSGPTASQYDRENRSPLSSTPPLKKLRLSSEVTNEVNEASTRHQQFSDNATNDKSAYDPRRKEDGAPVTENHSMEKSVSSLPAENESPRLRSPENDSNRHSPNKVIQSSQTDRREVYSNLLKQVFGSLKKKRAKAELSKDDIGTNSSTVALPLIQSPSDSVAIPFKDKVNADIVQSTEMSPQDKRDEKQSAEFQNGNSISAVVPSSVKSSTDAIIDSNLPPRNMPTIDSPNERTTVKSPFKSPPIPSNSKNQMKTPTVKSLNKNSEKEENDCMNSNQKAVPSSSVHSKSSVKSTSTTKRGVQKEKTTKQHIQNDNNSPTKLRFEIKILDHLSKKDESDPKSSSIQRNQTDKCVQSSTTSNVSFFHPNKHQTTFHLLEHGDLYIQAIPFNKKFLLNSVNLGYKLILLTNSQEEVSSEPNIHANPEKYFIILAPLSMVSESTSNKRGASVRCALIDSSDQTIATELRFSIPTLSSYQIIDCLDYSNDKEGTKNLWHDFQHSQEGHNKAMFIKFLQYAEVCLHIEQKFHYQFPQHMQSPLCPKLHSLLETNVWGTFKRGYFFRRLNIIRFSDKNADGIECGFVDYASLIFNKNVFFVPWKIWSTFFFAAFKDAMFGEECYDVRLLKRNKKTSFKIRFRKESLIVLEADLIQDPLVVQQKIKERKPFCAVRGNTFGKIISSLKLSGIFGTHSITGRQNDLINDYNMHRRIWAKGSIKAKKKSAIKSFTIYYFDMFDECESKEVVFEKNSINETIGRSLTILVVPESCQVSYIS